MVAILVLTTMVVFILVDFYYQTRKEEPLLVAKFESESDATIPMELVSGFKMPTAFSFHPGHGWAMKESGRRVRIGMDDFSARLLGQMDSIDLPARGRWLRQGEKGWAVTRGKRRFELLSPIEGEVVDVNEAILKDPRKLLADPYGVGWLLEVHSPGADGNLKNLLHGKLARRWMEEAVMDLNSKISGVTGAHMQDAGHPVSDILGQVPEERWDTLVEDFILTTPRIRD